MGEKVKVIDEIYLDNHSATRPSEELLDQLRTFQASYWASSSAPHAEGQMGHLPLVTALQKLYQLIGAHESDPFYYSFSSNEAIDQVYLSTYISHVKETGRTHFYATDLEESAILHSLKKMEKLGCSSKLLPVNHFGQLTKELLEEHLRPKAALLSLSWGCGLTGVIHPIEDIAEVCRKKNVLLHVEASNVIGKNYFRFEDMPIDFLTFDASYFHGPRGCAGVFVKALSPFIPQTMKQSSEPIAQIAILAEAFERAAENFDEMCTETARLRDRLESNIKEALTDVFFPFADAARLPNTSVICFPGVVSEALLYMLSSRGVYATMGGGSFQKLSHILQLCKIDKMHSMGALSFSLSYQTTEQQVDRASQIIVDGYKTLVAASKHLYLGASV
jgi:cysteine desulfurase